MPLKFVDGIIQTGFAVQETVDLAMVMVVGARTSTGDW